MLRPLVAGGAAVDAPSRTQKTPLIFAAQKLRPGCVAELLALGAAPNKRNVEGMTAACFAAQGGSAEVLRALLDDPRTDLHAPAEHVSSLGGRTPLHFAAHGGHVDVADFLIRSGADADARTTKEGHTHLCLAAAGGHAEVVELLLRHGAQPDVAAADGQTPLQLAEAKGHSRAVAALRRAAGAAAD